MATDFNITMKQYNGVDYDVLYPKTTAEQVDGIDSYLPKSGGTMTGDLKVQESPVSSESAVSKSYAQSLFATAQSAANQAKSAAETAQTVANAALPKAGGTMTGALTLNGDPTEDLQAATKQYVDSKAAGLSKELLATITSSSSSSSTTNITGTTSAFAWEKMLKLRSITIQFTPSVNSGNGFIGVGKSDNFTTVFSGSLSGANIELTLPVTGYSLYEVSGQKIYVGINNKNAVFFTNSPLVEIYLCGAYLSYYGSIKVYGNFAE